MSIRTKVDVELCDFDVPDTVIEILPTTEFPPTMAPTRRRWDLSELSVEDLIYLCDEFRNEVFIKAGKSMPIFGVGGKGGSINDVGDL